MLNIDCCSSFMIRVIYQPDTNNNFDSHHFNISLLTLISIYKENVANVL